MPRYIDAEKTIAILDNDLKTGDEMVSISFVKSWLNIQPTTDVVEVVRCVDCDVPHNKWTGCPNLNGMIPPPDFYCARGQRKQQTDGATDMNVGNKSECNVCSRITEANKDIFWTFARTHQPQDKEEYHRVPARFCPACGRAFK